MQWRTTAVGGTDGVTVGTVDRLQHNKSALHISDISTATISFSAYFIGAVGGVHALIIYKGLRGIHGCEIEFLKCSLSGTCSWGPLGGAFCSLSICFARTGCDIKLNRLLTGRWVDSQAAGTHTLTGSLTRLAMDQRSINQSKIDPKSLPSVSVRILYLFLICTDGNPWAQLRFTEAITEEMPLPLPGRPSAAHFLCPPAESAALVDNTDVSLTQDVCRGNE